MLPGRGGAGLRVADIHQRVEVPAHPGGRDTEPVTDLTGGDRPRFQQQLNDRATRAAIGAGSRRLSGSSLGTEFHNTIVTEFRNPVKQGCPYGGGEHTDAGYAAVVAFRLKALSTSIAG